MKVGPLAQLDEKLSLETGKAEAGLVSIGSNDSDTKRKPNFEDFVFYAEQQRLSDKKIDAKL